MARIPDTEIARLKRDVPIAELARTSGVELRPFGKDLRAHCLFHSPDEDPSLSIDPEKNVFHCFGCGAKGSVVDWVMRTEGLGFRDAVERLRGHLPAMPATSRSNGARGNGASPNTDALSEQAAVNLGSEGPELLAQVVAFYHRTLKETTHALDYLERREIASPEAIDRFQLGYADRTAKLGLPPRNHKAGIEIREKLKALGVLRQRTGQEHLGGSLVVPIFDADGRVVQLYGRKVRDDVQPPYHLYLPGPQRGVWNLDALRVHEELILCESLIDALTFWCAGYRNVTATYGTNGFTDDHRQAIAEHGVRRVLLAFDRDDAGEAAAEKLAGELVALGLECFRVQFPRGMDANDYARVVKPATKSLGLAIRQALWLGKGPAPAKRPGGEPEPTHPVEPPPSKTELAKEEGGPDPLLPLASPPPPATSSTVEPEPSEPVASPMPPAPEPGVEAEVKPEEVVIALGDRRYRVRGLAKNLSYDVLKVNLFVSRAEGYHVDTFDLYAARHRASFQKLAAVELGVKEEVVKKDLGKVLLKLEELQDQEIQRALSPPEEPAVTMSDEERREALELLEDPRLLDRVLEDFERSGVVGEETNKLVGFLAAISRKTEDPLAIILQSSSAAGKTSLMEAILAFMPEEERVKYSAMTGQSLFYMGETNLKHKILAIVEEEGAERATYALKLLQSEHELSIASTGKDPASGKLVTHEYRVEGPVMIFLTTTAIDLDEELRNRCLVLTVDESREQTRAIHRLQRERRTLEGLRVRSGRQAIVRRHQNAQRLLEPLAVRNPWARGLTFLDTQTRTRRDHEKYLTLIDSIALLHQKQRRIGCFEDTDGREVAYVDVELDDIETANRLAHEVLGWSLDELPPQTRKLLALIVELVRDACRRQGIETPDYLFTQRQVREYTGWGMTQIKVHMKRLVDMEYLVAHQGGRGLRFVYELVDGIREEEAVFLPGLIDVESLKATVAENRSGLEADRSGVEEEKSAPGRPQVGGVSGGGRTRLYPVESEASGENRPLRPENAHLEPEKTAPSDGRARRGEPATAELEA